MKHLSKQACRSLNISMPVHVTVPAILHGETHCISSIEERRAGHVLCMQTSKGWTAKPATALINSAAQALSVDSVLHTGRDKQSTGVTLTAEAREWMVVFSTSTSSVGTPAAHACIPG